MSSRIYGRLEDVLEASSKDIVVTNNIVSDELS